MRHTALVDYHGVPLFVEFDHYPGYAESSTFFWDEPLEPPEPESCELLSVKAGAVDIEPILTDDQVHEIEQLAVDWLEDERERWAEAHRDAVRDEQMEQS